MRESLLKIAFACSLSILAAGCLFCDRHTIKPVSQIIRVQSGHRYYFDLEENATTGYSWLSSCDSSDVEVRMDRQPPPKPEPGEPAICGAPGKVAVTIRIHRGFDGPAHVWFKYKRPWEKEPIESFTISLYKATGDLAFWE